MKKKQDTKDKPKKREKPQTVPGDVRPVNERSTFDDDEARQSTERERPR